MTEMLMYGDIFFYQDEEYVHLALGSGVIYAARILSKPHSESIIDARDGAVKREGDERTRQKILYCFVQLTTGKYADRIAHLQASDSQKNEKTILTSRPVERICKDDAIALQEEIMRGPVPTELKKQVADLDFSDYGS